MNFKPQDIAGHLRNDFSGIAANESSIACDMQPHEWVMTRMNMEIPNIVDSFHMTIASVLRDMDISHAVAKQTGMMDGEKLAPDETPERPSIDLAFWESIDANLWSLAVQSYHDDLLQNDPVKYRKIYESLGPELVAEFEATGNPENEKAGMAVGTVFEQAMIEDVEALRRLKATILHNIPHVGIKIEMRVLEPETEGAMTLMTPVIVLTALKDPDLRVPLRRYVDNPQGEGPAGLRPA